MRKPSTHTVWSVLFAVAIFAGLADRRIAISKTKAEATAEAEYQTFKRVSAGVWDDVEECKRLNPEREAQVAECEPIARTALRMMLRDGPFKAPQRVTYTLINEK